MLLCVLGREKVVRESKQRKRRREINKRSVVGMRGRRKMGERNQQELERAWKTGGGKNENIDAQKDSVQ